MAVRLNIGQAVVEVEAEQGWAKGAPRGSNLNGWACCGSEAGYWAGCG